MALAQSLTEVEATIARVAAFPRLRYMGSKYKLVRHLTEVFADLAPRTALDAFSGSGVVAYTLKSLGAAVTANDFLAFPTVIAEAAVARWRCPFCAGFLRSRAFPRTMRRAKTVPLVPIDEECEKRCQGILTAQAVEMAWWQRITYGTTAWRISMGRRQVAESVNAALKGAFTDLGRGFMRVMGVTKMTVMLGFTLAAFNLDRIRSFRAKHALDEQGRPTEKPKRTRARRRTGTWSDVIEPTDPPPP